MSNGERETRVPGTEQRHWLSQPATIRRLWVIFAVVLAITVVAEAFVHMHPRFRIEGWFGFHAGYGFLACIGMVLFAKGLGFFLKRPDDYYPGSAEPPARGEQRRD